MKPKEKTHFAGLMALAVMLVSGQTPAAVLAVDFNYNDSRPGLIQSGLETGALGEMTVVNSSAYSTGKAPGGAGKARLNFAAAGITPLAIIARAKSADPRRHQWIRTHIGSQIFDGHVVCQHHRYRFDEKAPGSTRAARNL